MKTWQSTLQSSIGNFGRKFNLHNPQYCAHTVSLHFQIYTYCMQMNMYNLRSTYATQYELCITYFLGIPKYNIHTPQCRVALGEGVHSIQFNGLKLLDICKVYRESVAS